MRACLLLMLLSVTRAAQADSFIGGQVTPSATEPTCDNVTPRLVPCVTRVPQAGVAAKEDEVIWLAPKQPKRRQTVVPMSPLKPGMVRIENSSISVSPGVQVNTGVEVR